MLGQKSTFVSMVKCLAFVVLFLFSVESSGAQTRPCGRFNDAPVASEPTLKKIEVETSATVPVQAQCTAANTVKAEVVALAQPIFLNRLGTVIPGGMVFALKHDTVGGQGTQLRADKRPRPIVLRANVGDCIEIMLTNTIPAANFKVTTQALPNPQTSGSSHVQGMSGLQGHRTTAHLWVEIIPVLHRLRRRLSPRRRVLRGQATQKYTFSPAEGTFLAYSMGDTEFHRSHITNGLFGALNNQLAEPEWYQSQVTQGGSGCDDGHDCRRSPDQPQRSLSSGRYLS